ncbi:hypothetical protein WJX72_008852 [[Myrmecia] bisecta]|uniref:Peptidase M20 dimerisation domain-containing protein n=1 Tax=[Myrmecia] bisecta TaxID=41462 RepID=A0AAW1PTR7_9CHLO
MDGLHCRGCGRHNTARAPEEVQKSPQQPLDYLTEKQSDFSADLIELARIPSISSLPEHAGDVEKASKWVEGRLKLAGLEDVTVLETGTQPAVFGQWLHASGQPTVMIYGHYDVQPVDPLELWAVPPFEPVVKDGFYRGRGVDDDKGGLLQPIQALEAYLKTVRSLPINVKFLIEGQEEVGSPQLPALLRKHKKLLSCDYALSADGSQINEQQGGIAIGLRGAVAVEVEAQTVDSDLHSGVKGGSVQNPINALAQFIAGLHLPNRTVAIEGFYDNVRDITEEDKADFARFPYSDDVEMKSLGALGPFGEEGYTTLERRWLRPTLDVVGIYGGFQGEGIKTIIPSKATAKLSARLVPDQDPEHILKVLERHVEQHAPPFTKMTFKLLGFRAAPYAMPRDTLPNRAAAKALELVFGNTPLLYREGGTIPAMALFREHLGVDMTAFGFGLPDDNIHAPNERYRVSMFKKGREAYVHIFQAIADLGSAAAARAKEEL